MGILAHMPRTKSKVGDEGVPRTAKFDEAASAALVKLRTAVGALLEGLPGPVRGAADIQRVLGLDWALCWQLHKVGTVADPIEAGPDVPRAVPFGKALRAAGEKGVATEVLERAREAFEEFERVVLVHAGDRGAFDSMVRALRPDAAHITMKERRGAFRSLASIWGVQAEARYHCAIASPGEKAGLEDAIVLTGYVGIKKLRPGAAVALGSRSRFGPMSNTTPTENVAVDVLAQFCTQPAPQITLKNLDSGVVESMLEVGDVGLMGATTYFLRWMIHDSPIETSPARWGSSVVNRLPCERVVMDLCVPAGLTNPKTTQVETFGNLRQPDRGWSRDPADRMPVGETMTHLGRNFDRMQTPLVPRCPEMVRAVLTEAGWQDKTFDIYRCVVEYPILHACVATRVDRVAEE